MASPFNYTISSYIVSDYNGSESNVYEDDESPFQDEEEISEISITTDMDTSVNDSEYDNHDPEVAIVDDDDYVDDESFQEDENFDDENNDEVEQEPTRVKLDVDQQSEGGEIIDSSQKCSICLGAWTNVGEHRVCSLQCGHCFGYNCIKQWLNSNNPGARKCPQCNAKASERHIRFIYPSKITCIDNSEIELMKKKFHEVNALKQKLSKALKREKKRTRKYKRMYKAKTLALTADFDLGISD